MLDRLCEILATMGVQPSRADSDTMRQAMDQLAEESGWEAARLAISALADACGAPLTLQTH